MKMRLFNQKSKKATNRKFVTSAAAAIQKNPSLAGGATALFVVMGLVSVNAVWFQAGKHPSPMFSTRVATKSVEQIASSGSKLRTVKLNIQAAKKQKITVLPDDLTREVQIVLANKGLYEGELDGLFGFRTRLAIKAYQKQAGQNETGKVSARLLSHMLMSGKPEGRIPVPKLQIALAEEKSGTTAQTARQNMVSTIQSGLRNYGYEDIVIDGVMGSQTSNAIRRFELDYGLRITGKASESILQKLTDIGAIDQG